MEFSPVALQQKKAQEILNDKLYKSDFEKTVKGRGMTFDLHGTPAMDQIKKAEGIKSDVSKAFLFFKESVGGWRCGANSDSPA